MATALRAVIAGLMIVITLSLGNILVSDIADNTAGIEMPGDEVVELGATNEFTTINNGEGTDETVRNSRGYAVNLTGSDDSYVESKDGYTIAEDNTWAVSTWARVDSDASSDDMTAVSANGRVIIEYAGSRSEWSVWYYDEGNRDSYMVNVSAPNQPANFTNVIAWSNGTHLTVYRNNTQGEVVEISGDNSVDAPVSSTNWNGRLDEVRTFDSPINDSVRSEIVASPIAPQPDTNRTSRVMFDEPDKNSQSIFFTGTRMEHSNVQFSPGLDGQVLSRGTDYEWNTEGPQIKPLSGGELDGAPVAYVDYTFESALHSTIEGWGDAVRIAAMIPMILIIGVIIARLRGA